MILALLYSFSKGTVQFSSQNERGVGKHHVKTELKYTSN